MLIAVHFALFGNFGVVIELAGAAAFFYGIASSSVLHGERVRRSHYFLFFSFLVEDHCCALDFCSYSHLEPEKGYQS